MSSSLTINLPVEIDTDMSWAVQEATVACIELKGHMAVTLVGATKGRGEIRWIDFAMKLSVKGAAMHCNLTQSPDEKCMLVT